MARVGSSGTGGGGINFSYEIIVSGAPLTIPLNQQMIVYHELDIHDTLTISGTLVMLYG